MADDDLGPGLDRAMWPLTVLATLFLGLRLYCKIRHRRPLWWDDYVLVASWVALVLSTALETVAVAQGLGKSSAQLVASLQDHHDTNDTNDNNDAVDVVVDAIRAISEYSYIAGFFTILAAMWGKASFALTLLRIATPGGWIRYAVWFILVTVLLVMGGGAVIQWVQCWPVASLWDHTIPGTCLSSEMVQHYDLFMSVYSGTMDIVLALLPWRIIWHVQISKKEKFGALFAMGMGVFAGLASILKIAALFAIGNPDMSTTVILFVFGTAEAAITIMAASIPVLRALMQRSKRPKAAAPRRDGEPPARPTTPQRLSQQKEADLEW
ncbi:hypothetical protein SPI_06348 [Niveomyces insectorum RCEF 264]|uniref:Rhodopsin domain-containing protein n=1 Tax=Niveomyces insectorum RCEF 264 TaxID=1081102 RepID=A0A167S1P8_9HYPO|nr:hypothetical protein SPI_06348 [Niveomyces insectorum RCEF 264]